MVKRRSRSTPPAAKRPPVVIPGTPGPFEEDNVRTGLQAKYPGASPISTGKLLSFKRQLFAPVDMITRGMAQQGSSSLLSTASTSDQPESQDATQAPADQGNLLQLPLGDDIVEMPAGNPRRQRYRPDLEDVVTQQTELLAAMLQRLNQQPAQPAAQANVDEPRADPDFQWERLCMPPETNFPVPGDGVIQRMATSLFAKVPNPHRSGPTRGTVCVAVRVVVAGPGRFRPEMGLPTSKCLLYCGFSRMAGRYSCLLGQHCVDGLFLTTRNGHPASRKLSAPTTARHQETTADATTATASAAGAAQGARRPKKSQPGERKR